VAHFKLIYIWKWI